MTSKVNIPDNIYCTKSHEYVVIENDTAILGITEYASEQLGEIVYVELPDVGTKLSKGDVFGTVESVKAASELYMPLSGTISEVNEKLITEPELINEDCYNEGWIVKVSEFSEQDLEEALSMEDYLSFIEE